jgi:Lon protease-like protein
MAENESIPTCVPIFPLPDVVLFPRQVLPLHIFEPRYRAMTEDVLAGHRAIAIALLRPGFESEYFTPQAAIHRIIGVGRIVAAERLTDGKFNMLLRGEGRASIVREHDGRPYRVAEIRPLDTHCSVAEREARCLRKRLQETIASANECVLASRDAFLKLFDAELSLGGLVDLLASSAPIAGEIRQALLDELDDAARAEKLIESFSVLNAVSRINRTAGRLDCAGHN